MTPWTLLRENHPRAGIVDVVVADDAVTVTCARPGLLIGKRGATASDITASLSALLGRAVALHIVEVRREQWEPRLLVDRLLDSLLSSALPRERGDDEADNEHVDVVIPAGPDLARLEHLCALSVSEAVRVGAHAAFVVVRNVGGVVVEAGAVDVVGAVVVEDSVFVFGQVFSCRAGVVRPA